MASTKYLTCIHKLPQNANLNQALESTNAAPRLPHRSPTWPDVVSSVRLADSPPFFFFFYSRLLGQVRADSSINGNRYDRNGHRNRSIRPILAEMGSDCHSFASCGLVRGKKKKKDGRKIKVCNKRI